MFSQHSASGMLRADENKVTFTQKKQLQEIAVSF
jgi:hypothetical protein